MLHTGIFPGIIMCCKAEEMLWSPPKKWSRLQPSLPRSNSERQQQQLLCLPWDLQNVLRKSCFIPVFSLQAFKTKEFSHQELWRRYLKHENGKEAKSKPCGVVGNMWEVWSHGAEIPIGKKDQCWKKHSMSSASSRTCFPGPLVEGKAPVSWWLCKIPLEAVEILLAIPMFPLAAFIALVGWECHGKCHINLMEGFQQRYSHSRKNTLEVLVLFWGHCKWTTSPFCTAAPSYGWVGILSIKSGIQQKFKLNLRHNGKNHSPEGWAGADRDWRISMFLLEASPGSSSRWLQIPPWRISRFLLEALKQWEFLE